MWFYPTLQCKYTIVSTMCTHTIFANMYTYICRVLLSIYAYTYSIINYKVSNTKQPRKPKALDTTHVNFNRNDDRAVIYTSDTTMMTKFNKLVEIAGTEWKDIVLDLMVFNASANKAITDTIKRMNEKGKPIEHFSAHTLRDTFATRYIEQGGTPQTLKTILGHSSIAMTMDRYSHVLPNTKQEEMNKISGIFKTVTG